jgi:hypothetical protein
MIFTKVIAHFLPIDAPQAAALEINAFLSWEGATSTR